MVYHELQALPLSFVRRIAQIKDDVDVILMFLIRNEAAIDIDGFIEQGPDLVSYAIDEICKQIFSMQVSDKEISYLHQCTVVHSLG